MRLTPISFPGQVYKEVESCTLNEVHSPELGGPIEKDLMDSPTKERLSL